MIKGLRDILDFNDPRKQEELERLYGKTVTSWEEVKNWDDVVIKEQKALVSELEAEALGKEICPHLKKLDNYFCYCGKRAASMENAGCRKTEKPEINSSQYNSHVDHFELQLWCMQPLDRHKKCMYFQQE